MLIIDSCQALTPDTEGSQVALRSKMSIFAPDSPPGRRFALPVGGQSLTGRGMTTALPPFDPSGQLSCG